jgi:putative oxidoreductase
MQRRFSTFPDGWPGRGLLILRLGAGVPLIYSGVHGLFEGLGEPITVARDLIETAWGILLLAGMWTPLAGAVIAIHELWIAFSIHFSLHDQHVFLAVLSAGVSMLGPGAWSVDARLFGRKVFDSEERPRKW